MGETTDKNNKYCNIPIWHRHGITGKGIAVWNCEGDSGHGHKSRGRILDSAPDATVFSGNVSYSSKNGALVNPIVHLESGDVPLEGFIANNNIRVVNASLSPSPFSYPGYKTRKEWKDLIEKYDLCCFASSANDGDRKKNFDNSDFGWWYIGAMYMHAGNENDLRRHGYSNGGEGLDFIDFTGDWSGTSSSSPYLAGKCALIRQRYPHLNRFEVYEYMKAHAADLGDPGEDTLFGHGLVILPDDFRAEDKEEEDVEITKTKVLVDDKIIEVKRVMVNNENYIRLRDFDDVLHICKVDYDKAKNLPIVKKG